MRGTVKIYESSTRARCQPSCHWCIRARCLHDGPRRKEQIHGSSQVVSERNCVQARQKRKCVWVGRWWEYGLARDGSSRRVRRSRVLGTLTELHSRREAQCCLDRDLNKANSGRQRVESKMKFRNFIEGRWINDVLPAYKLSTRLQYRYFMDRHLLPYFGEWKLEDIRSEEVQHFLRLLPKLAPKTVRDRKSTRLNSSHRCISYAVFCLKKKKKVFD